MFLDNIKLYNFRKFVVSSDGRPGLMVKFHPGLNIIVGENDSGKTAVIDAIKMMLGTVSDDYYSIQDDDFYFDGTDYSHSFKIEAVFKDLNAHEAGTFLEWLSFDEHNHYELHLRLTVEKKTSEAGRQYLDRELVAGDDGAETSLRSGALSYLRVTYLKALRNASDELTPGFRSHLPQLLAAHSQLRNHPENKQLLVDALQESNVTIEKYLSEGFPIDSSSSDEIASEDTPQKPSINGELQEVLKELFDNRDQGKGKTRFQLTQATLNQILKQLSLSSESINLGLGNLNLLYISTELALLKDHSQSVIYGPNIMLIEELEAHLHVQAQIRLIKYIQDYILEGTQDASQQFILTSHSIALTASVDQRSLIYMNSGEAFSIAPEDTMLKDKDYDFLNRFLDATKSNLFFAKGIILVEGYAENILLPALGELIGFPLHRYGISVVNVEGTSFEQYVKLFSQKEGNPAISTPIAIVTDSDVKPEVFKITETNLSEVKRLITNPQNLDKSLFGEPYPTFSALTNAFKLEFTNTQAKKLRQQVLASLDDDEWARQTQTKQNKLDEKYAPLSANSKVLISPLWTLEYSLLHSPLRDLMIQAIAEKQYLPGNKRDKKITDFQSEFESKPHEAASHAYEAMDKGGVSKTEVSERLVELLAEMKPDERNGLKAKILGTQSGDLDPYCKYLVDAIKFACGQEVED